jgi:hypothetical protein
MEKYLTEKQIETITPLVHMNGDSKETLETMWERFERAIQDAIDAAPEIHGRNYYPKDNDHGAKARHYLRKMLCQLDSVRRSAFVVREAIDEQ